MFPPDNEFGKMNFPSIPDPAREDIKESDLYPKNLQDEVNEDYGHDKVLRRIPGVDFTEDPEMTPDTQKPSDQESTYK